MTDFPDWHQPVADALVANTLYSGNIGASGDQRKLDVSQYASVVVFTNAPQLTADFYVDSAGNQLVQELLVPGGGWPMLVTAPYLWITNSDAFLHTLTVIGYNRAIPQQSMYTAQNYGYRCHTGTTNMAAGSTYTLLAEFGSVPYGLCHLWWQIGGATTTMGILNAVMANNDTLELDDTNRISANGTGIGRTNELMVAIPPGCVDITFSCVVAGSSDVRAALAPAA